MSIDFLTTSEVFRWVLLPLLIFSARVLDVSLGTIRIIFVSKGLKYIAPVVGFFEVLIWLLAIRVIMQNLNNVACYLAYGAGFGTGTFIGLNIEKKLALGKSLLRIITQKDATELIGHLRSKGYSVTTQAANGKTGPVHIIHMIIKRHDFEYIAGIIKKFNPKAFYTLEDIEFVSKETFPRKKSRPLVGPFQFWRKGK